MFEQILDTDTALFLYLNGLHAAWSDGFMFFISNIFVWIPLYLFLVFLLIKEYKWQSFGILFALIITVIFTFLITESFMKPFFERLRPTHTPAIQNIVHTVNEYRGGQFSFASSHAAFSFGIAHFAWLALRKRFTWIGVFFLWAVIISYSRIYLGVHYPTDIIAGALVGLFSGYCSFLIFEILLNKITIFS